MFVFLGRRYFQIDVSTWPWLKVDYEDPLNHHKVHYHHNMFNCLLPGGRVDLSASASQRLWPRKGFFSRSSNTSRSKSHLLLILRPKESLFCTKVSVSVSLCPCLCLCLQVSSILINCQQCYICLYDSFAVLWRLWHAKLSNTLSHSVTDKVTNWAILNG